MQMKITEAQAEALRKNRVNSTKVDGQRRRYNSYGKSVKRGIYADIKRQHGLSRSKKIVFFLDNVDNPLYLVIRDKRTKLPLDDGKQPALEAPKALGQVETKKPDAAAVDDFDFEAEFNQLLLEALTAQAGTTPSKAAKADAVAKVATAVKAVKAVKASAKPAAKASAKAVKPVPKAVKAKAPAKAVKPAAKAVKAKPAPNAKAK
jgi:hypothetical protein